MKCGVFFVLLLVLLPLVGNDAYGVLTCTYKASGCSTGEKALVSIADDAAFTNSNRGSHVGGPGDYVSAICCTEPTDLRVSSTSGNSCPSGQRGVVLLNKYASTGSDDSHVVDLFVTPSESTIEGRICAGSPGSSQQEINCYVTGSKSTRTDVCSSDEQLIAKLEKKENSHVFRKDLYGYGLCCAVGGFDKLPFRASVTATPSPVIAPGKVTFILSIPAGEYKSPTNYWKIEIDGVKKYEGTDDINLGAGGSSKTIEHSVPGCKSPNEPFNVKLTVQDTSAGSSGIGETSFACGTACEPQTSCSNYKNPSCCKTIGAPTYQYCDWTESSCVGTPTACDTWNNDRIQCEDPKNKATGSNTKELADGTTVCGFNAYCTGTPASCSTYTTPSTCGGADCSWTIVENCRGSPLCEDMSGVDSDNCDTVSGCYWDRGGSSSCSGTNNIECSSRTTPGTCTGACRWTNPEADEPGYCLRAPCSTWNNDESSCKSYCGSSAWNPARAASCTGEVLCQHIGPEVDWDGSKYCGFGCSLSYEDSYCRTPDTPRSCSDYADSRTRCEQAGCTYSTKCEGERVACSVYNSNQDACISNEGCDGPIVSIKDNNGGYCASDFSPEYNKDTFSKGFVRGYCSGHIRNERVEACHATGDSGAVSPATPAEICDGSNLNGHACSDGDGQHRSANGHTFEGGQLACQPSRIEWDHTNCWWDDTPPSTSLSITSGVLGENGWYRSPVSFRLSCYSTPDGDSDSQSRDNPSRAHGCENTNWCQGEGCEPSLSSSSTSGTTSGEGRIVIRYHSKDDEGNPEEIQKRVFYIDYTDPVFSESYLDVDEQVGYPRKNITIQTNYLVAETKAIDAISGSVGQK